jgi:hypothetical protein
MIALSAAKLLDGIIATPACSSSGSHAWVTSAVKGRGLFYA